MGDLGHFVKMSFTVEIETVAQDAKEVVANDEQDLVFNGNQDNGMVLAADSMVKNEEENRRAKHAVATLIKALRSLDRGLQKHIAGIRSFMIPNL